MTPAEFYRSIAQEMVEFPQALEVFEEDGRIIVTASDNDYGKLIGMSGRNFRACEDLLQYLAMRQGQRHIRLVIDNKNAKASFPTRYNHKHDWCEADDKAFEKLAQNLLEKLLGESGWKCGVTTEGMGSVLSIWFWEDAHERVKEALQIIFRAIGKNQGRHLTVNINADQIKDQKGSRTNTR